MEIDLPDTISTETIGQAMCAVDALRRAETLPDWIPPGSAAALLAVMDAVAQSASADPADLTLSEASGRLRVARPSVMRLIARGELSARKEVGHYFVAPREVRAFQARMAPVRREALAELARMAEACDL